MSKGLPNRDTDFSAWYTQVVHRAGLADYGPVKGTMVIKPYGFQLWDHIKEAFDKTNVDAVAAANIFYYVDQSVFLAKKYLFEAGINVRQPDLMKI